MGSGCLWAGVEHMMNLLCSGHNDSWPQEHPVDVMGMMDLLCSGHSDSWPHEHPAGVMDMMVLLCSGHSDSWPREHHADMMDIPRLSGCERLVDAEEARADMFGIDVLVTEG